MKNESLRDRFRGCITGVAVGDALGMQVEELTREEIKRNYGLVKDYGRAPPDHPNHKLLPGMFTDDTEQTLNLAESIVEKGRFDVGHFAHKISQWGKKILENPELDRFSGGTSKKAIKKLLSGIDWLESGEEGTTCGSAMRVSPIGLFYHQDLDLVEKYAKMSSTPTHTSHAARAGAIAVAVGVACNIRNLDMETILKEVAERCSREDPDLADKIYLSYDLKEEDIDSAVRKIGNSSSVYETVPFAFYSFFSNLNDFESSVITAVNAGGDTDSIGAITGALSGARHGIRAIPRRWLDGLEKRDYLIDIADKLLELAIRMGR